MTGDSSGWPDIEGFVHDGEEYLPIAPDPTYDDLLAQAKAIGEQVRAEIIAETGHPPTLELEPAAIEPCGAPIGDLWVPTVTHQGRVLESRCITLTCTAVNPVPGLPFDHQHVYWDPVGGLAVTRHTAPVRTVDAKGCIRDD